MSTISGVGVSFHVGMTRAREVKTLITNGLGLISSAICIFIEKLSMGASIFYALWRHIEMRIESSELILIFGYRMLKISGSVPIINMFGIDNYNTAK